MSFLPAGAVATIAHAASLGMRGGARRRKKRRGKTRAKGTRRKAKRASSGSRKPKPGTKAWMAYIRGKRGKKRK